MKKELYELVLSHRKIVVITGAGISTASGIPAYRDATGAWQHSQPMQYQDFVSSELARKRYWARSALGRNRFKKAVPNTAHLALARLEELGLVKLLITQNVDGLHQLAGQKNMIDLHGSLDQVICLDCGEAIERDEVQTYLMQRNSFLVSLDSALLPDGDAKIDDIDFSGLDIPDCLHCHGRLKPDVVFYGENVPRARVDASFAALNECDALLVVGSSLMVYSGFRFVRFAHAKGIPVLAINQGLTRADNLLQLKIEEDCARVLDELVGCIESATQLS